jgi:Transposase IS66 family
MRQAKAARVVDQVQSLIRENRRGMSKERGSSWSADDSQILGAERMAEDVRRLLFLRQPGTPIDNNICEQVLKRAVLHRKILCFTAPWAAPRWAISS